MSGSLATTSTRKPAGTLKAAALSSGVIGGGASVGFGIWAKAICAATSSPPIRALDFRRQYEARVDIQIRGRHLRRKPARRRSATGVASTWIGDRLVMAVAGAIAIEPFAELFARRGTAVNPKPIAELPALLRSQHPISSCRYVRVD